MNPTRKVNRAIAGDVGTSDGHDVLKGYKREEVGVIPEGWDCSQLGNLTTRVGSGMTPTGGKRVYVEAGRPFLRSQNVGWGHLNLDDLAFITDEIHALFTASEIKEGDVLLNITGASIGRSAVADSSVVRGNVNQHVCELRPDPDKLDPYFLNGYLLSAAGQKQIDSFQAGGNRQGLNYSQIRSFLIPHPSLTEQRAISMALSDVDALLDGLDRLIAKKRDLKQAAMQQLVTGQMRLPGFSANWVTFYLGDISHIKTGNRNHEDKEDGGRFPFFVRSERVECIDSFSYDCEAIIVPGEGNIGSVLHYISGRFDLHQRVYKISGFPDCIHGKFIYFAMAHGFGRHAMRNTVKATVDSLRLPTFLSFELRVPSTICEQRAIATLLSDMDAEIAALESRRDKTGYLKHTMMQELLTGRMRLVQPEVTHA